MQEGIDTATIGAHLALPELLQGRANRKTGSTAPPVVVTDNRKRLRLVKALSKPGAVKGSDRGPVVTKIGGSKAFGAPPVRQVVKATERGEFVRTNDDRLATRDQISAGRELSQARKEARRGGVSGPLTKGQKKFVDALAKETGMSPKVLGGWALSEMSSGPAQRREAEGNHNWLNVGYFDAGPGELTRDSVWGTPQSAAKATAQFLRGERFGPSEGIKQIMATADQAAERQIQAIAGSGWASSGYEGGDSLRATSRMVNVEPPSPGARDRLQQARQRAQQLGLPGGAGAPARPEPKLGELVGQSLEGSSPAIVQFGRVLAGRVGMPLQVNSAARPGSITTSGNVSDHSTGNALDIHALSRREGGSLADEEMGNRIAFEAVLAAGGTQEQAAQMARDGGALSVVNEDGVRTQIIWRSDVGGNHHNHVHVGISGASGDGGFVPGTGTFTGSLPAGSVTQLTEATGMSAGQIDQAVAQNPSLADGMLGSLGFSGGAVPEAPTAARPVMPDQVQPQEGEGEVPVAGEYVSAVLRRRRA